MGITPKESSVYCLRNLLLYCFSFSSFVIFPAEVVWGWNDPVAMYPLQAMENDISRCDNGDAQYLDDGKTLPWPTKSPSFHVSKLTRVIRITNKDGNFKLKDLTMIIRFRASTLGMWTLAQFVAHDKPILLLSLDDRNLHFSLHSKCENKMRIKKLKVANSTAMKDWTFAAVTYNQTSGYATLYAGDGSTHSARWGYVNIQEPQYIYLGNNIEFMREASDHDEQEAPENFSGKIRCFILYRRALEFSQITKVESFCRKIGRKGDDTDDDDDDDDIDDDDDDDDDIDDDDDDDDGIDDDDDDDDDIDESHADDKIGTCKHEMGNFRKYFDDINFSDQVADDFFFQIYLVHSTRCPKTP